MARSALAAALWSNSMSNLEIKATKPVRIVIVTPVYNDWESFKKLVPNIDKYLRDRAVSVKFIAVDDGSFQEPKLTEHDWGQMDVVNSLEILRLTSNQGHQRAIAIGLSRVAVDADADVVIVMDCDGEDRPQDIGALLDAHLKTPNAIIVASRATRSEGFAFVVLYAVYKHCFRAMTGKSIDFGNFSMIPMPLLARLVHLPEAWNHLAGTIVRSRLPIVRVATDRGLRYAGQSSMNLVSLIIHGLSGISVFSDTVFVRLLLIASLLGAGTMTMAAALVALRLLTDWTPPGWTSTTIVSLVIVFMQVLLFSGGAIFMQLQRRSSPTVIPAWVAPDYILGSIHFDLSV
jgi:polyisoprenyl-phosphate glycosyltransferase